MAGHSPAVNRRDLSSNAENTLVLSPASAFLAEIASNTCMRCQRTVKENVNLPF